MTQGKRRVVMTITATAEVESDENVALSMASALDQLLLDQDFRHRASNAKKEFRFRSLHSLNEAVDVYVSIDIHETDNRAVVDGVT